MEVAGRGSAPHTPTPVGTPEDATIAPGTSPIVAAGHPRCPAGGCREGAPLAAEVGPEAGVPLFWFHGSVVGNIGIESVAATATALGLRVICAARPGYAGSDWVEPGLAGMVRTIREPAGILGLSRYAAVGVSGGAPFAAALAASAPDEVAGLGILVGAGPPHLAAVSTDPDAVEERRLLALAAAGSRAEVADGLREIARTWVGCIAAAGPEDVPASFKAAVLDGASNGYDGYVFDMFSIRLPWDVPITGVTAPTFLVYGAADVTCPPALGRLVPRADPPGRAHRPDRRRPHGRVRKWLTRAAGDPPSRGRRWTP